MRDTKTECGHEHVLVRHPIPRPTESFYGYLLRVSQANGFDSIWSLFSRAGMEQHESRGTGIKFTKLAAITKRSPTELSALAYSTTGPKNECRLLDHSISAGNLDFSRPRICSLCVLNRGFIEAHWDLAYMVGCPIHLCWAVTHCSVCNSEMSWYRPELLQCKCGAKLHSNASESMPMSLCSLLEVVRAKVLRLLPFADCGATLPVYDLGRLDLDALLSIITLLGSCSMTMGASPAYDKDDIALMTAAANVLAAWPNNFFDLLHSVGSRRTEKSHNIREQFAPLYTSLFGRKITERIEDLDFLRIAFLEFISNHWDGRRVDVRTLKRVKNRVQKRFLSLTETARYLQIDPRTFKRHVQRNQLIMNEGPHATFIRDANFVEMGNIDERKCFRIRKAAAEIGVPVEVLRCLKEMGAFEVRHQVFGLPGFHQGDVNAFRMRLSALIPEQPGIPELQGVTTLRSFLRKSRYGAREKAKFIHELLRQEVSIVGCVDGTVQGLLISSAQLSVWMRCQVEPGEEGSISCVEAARLLNCDCEAVRTLIGLGFLRGDKRGGIWRIVERSVQEFDTTFVRLSSIASTLRSSSRCLIGLCKSQKVEVLEVRVGRAGVQPFVQRKSMESILKLSRSNL